MLSTSQKITRVILIVLVFYSLKGYCQSSWPNEVLLFEQPSTGRPALLVSDTLLITGPKLHDTTIIKKPLNISTAHFKKYRSVIKDVSFMIDDGGGPIIKMADNDISLITNEPRQNNQFGAACFSFNNDIYLWGGRGLFATKNILTSYNFNAHKWQRINTSGITISPRSHMIYTANNHQLWVYGGVNIDDQNLSSKKNELNHRVYVLDLNTMTWKKGPKIKHKYAAHTNGNAHQYFIKNTSFFLIDQNYIHEYNFEDNYIKTYANKQSKHIESIIYSHKTDTVSYLFKTPNNQLKFTATSLNNFLNKPLLTDQLYLKQTNWIFIPVGVLLLTLILIKIFKNIIF